MLLDIFFMCSICALVSPVPVNPSIPAQTYPIYQQNEYITPYMPPINDYNPYLVQNTAQNAPPLDFKQILLNRILSRPSIQAILDPNAFGYGLNEVPNSNLMPNVVNNYIILPMDCPNVNQTDSNNDNTIKEVTNAKTDENDNKKETKKKSKRRPREEQDKAKIERDKDTIKKGDGELTTPRQKSSRNTERKSSTTNNTNERNIKRDGKQRKQRLNEIIDNKENVIDDIIDKTQLNTSTRPRKRRKKTEIETDDNLLLNQNVNTEQINITPLIARGNNNTENSTTAPVLGDKEANTTKSAVTNDFMKTFPNIPEDMAKHFMTGMNQFNDPQLMRFFGNYEQFYQSLGTITQDANKRTKKRKKPKKNKRNRRRNRKNKAKHENIATNANKTPALENNVGTNPNNTVNMGSSPNSMRFKIKLNPVSVTADKPNPNNVETRPNTTEIINLNPKPITKALESIETVPTVGKTAALDIKDQFDEWDGREDGDNNEYDAHSMYYGLIEDYYPMFTDNAAFENKNINIKSLDGDRLFYIRDDVVNTDNEYSKRNVHDRDANIAGVEGQTERSNNANNVQFRPPPILESPDFITRKVERSEIPSNLFNDDIDLNNRKYDLDNNKYSSYSNAKSPNSGGKQSMRKPNDVETVYARSKVIKYGQIENSEEDADSQDDWDSFTNGDTTYVVARSFDSGEFW